MGFADIRATGEVMERLYVRMDLTVFPRKLRMKYGRDGNREWWEHWSGKRGIVAQRIIPGHFVLYFIDGNRVCEMLERRGDRVCCATFKDRERFKDVLERFGFSVEFIGSIRR